MKTTHPDQPGTKKVNAGGVKVHADAVARWVPTNCLHCGVPLPYEKSGHKFCGHSCAQSHNNIGVKRNFSKKPPVNPEGNCLSCGESVGIDRRFCNQSCYQAFRGVGVDHSPSSCGSCGKPIKPTQYFCSYQCQQDEDFRSRSDLANSTGNARDAWKTDHAIRRFLLKTRPNQCVLCDGVEWKNQPIPLVMDHINGNSDDWRLINLRLICPNCDAQTPTYKGKNKGKSGERARKRLEHYHMDRGLAKINDPGASED